MGKFTRKKRSQSEDLVDEAQCSMFAERARLERRRISERDRGVF